jgi:rRNA-processing protein FCF1
MSQVGLDTNALMMPVELDVRVFDELDRLLGGARQAPEPASGDEPRTDGYEPVTARAVVEELRRLKDSGMGEEAMAASVGLDLAMERCRIVEHGESYADDAVVALAETGAFDYVVTNDRPLRDRLLDAGVPVIGLRGRNQLAITRP